MLIHQDYGFFSTVYSGTECAITFQGHDPWNGLCFQHQYIWWV